VRLKSIKLWLLLSVVVTLAVLGLSFFLPHSYKASGLLIVNRQAENSGAANYFTYEGYYAEQTAQHYTDSIIGAIKSLSLQQLALKQAGLPSDSLAVKKFGSKVTVQKSGPQLITIFVSGDSPAIIKTLWQALSSQTVAAVAELSKTGDAKVTLQALNPEPLVEDTSPTPWLLGLATFLGMVAWGVLVIGTWCYLRGEK
jgi:capsular polysaccharide biosynthesis protein